MEKEGGAEFIYDNFSFLNQAKMGKLTDKIEKRTVKEMKKRKSPIRNWIRKIQNKSKKMQTLPEAKVEKKIESKHREFCEQYDVEFDGKLKEEQKEKSEAKEKDTMNKEIEK